MPVFDALGRPMRNLRLSVTDRCNLRCQYCMPEEEYQWLSKGDVLHFEEISRLVDIFIDLGVDKVRLTGGEPLLRRDVQVLVSMLSRKAAIRDLALTTNGLLLGAQAPDLFAAGLHRLTVSLDTLRPDRFRALTRRDELPRVLAGIDAAGAAGFQGLKLDTVVMRGTNDDELIDLLEYARSVGAELRYIEYMDVGGATLWSMDRVVPRAEILDRLGCHYGPIEALREENSAPADRFALADGTVFGIISSTTSPFCGSCDRSRLTADGLWYLCLYAPNGTDLRGPLRCGASDEQIKDLILPTWRQRQERGAEQRLQLRQRQPLLEAGDLKKDPHLEMHTRGG